MVLGTTIKLIRINSGITQKQISNNAEIAQGYYSIIENNGAEPSISVLQRIAEALDVPLFFIIWMATEKKTMKNKHKALYNAVSSEMTSYLEQIKQTTHNVK